MQSRGSTGNDHGDPRESIISALVADLLIDDEMEKRVAWRISVARQEYLKQMTESHLEAHACSCMLLYADSKSTLDSVVSCQSLIESEQVRASA